ncbi:MAG: hypothetical protein PHW03_00615 [Eubacteriales bacterium]|nr:hypothetical protein [Eubacteriales bacterium]MDD4389284.1 hypothetical protein [Eubacteriales bacterium]
MKSLKHKIYSNSGVTILIALVFFLLCAVVGAAVLAASSAAAGRVIGADVNEQAYYTTTSAARLIRDEIKNQKFEYYEEYESRNGVTSKTREGYITEPGGSLANLLKKAAKDSSVSIYNGASSYTDSLTIYPQSPGYQNNLSDVNGMFKMNGDYSIDVALELDGADKDKYAAKLTIPALIHKNKEIIEIDSYQEKKTGVIVVITRMETKLEWSAGTIVKN